MNAKNYMSPADALADLKSRGYEAEFEASPFCLYCGDVDLRFNHEEFKVDEVYRFETGSDAGDNSVVFAITSTTGVKGTLLDPHAAYALNMNFEMVRKFQH